MSEITYLGESRSCFILKIEHEGEFIGIAELRKCRPEWVKKYHSSGEIPT